MMKNMKTVIISGFATVAVMAMTSNAMASPRPAACPVAADIIKQGFMLVQKDDEEKTYIVAQVSNYETPEQWAFVMAVPYSEATTPGDAMNKATAALGSLKGTPKPRPYKKIWFCKYDNTYDYMSVSITPIDVGGAEFKQVKAAIQH